MEVPLNMKSNNTISVHSISEICDCIKGLDKGNQVSISVGEVGSEEKTKIDAFLQGISYANHIVLNVVEDTYSITIEESMAFINCDYSLKKKETFESTALNKNDLNLAVDALAEGRTIIIDLSKAKEDAVAYFHYLCGAAFALCADLDRVNEDTFMFIPRLISLPEDQNDLKQINEKMKKINDLIESDNDSAESEQIESLYKECIEILDEYGYLTPVRLYYSDYLCSIGNVDAAIEELDTFSDLYVNGDAKCNLLFLKVVAKDFELRMNRGGVVELKNFASKLMVQSNANEKSGNIVLEILNAEAEILIRNKNSREGLKILKNSLVDVVKCDLEIQLDFLFLKALAMYKTGRFGKSQRVIADMLSKIKSDDCNIIHYIGAKRLQASNYSKVGRYRKAIRIYEELINKIYIGDLDKFKIPYSGDCGSLAKIYLDNKNYNKAKALYLNAIEYSDDKKIISAYYHNLAVCYVKEKNNRKAKDYLTKAISLRMELSDDPFYDYCDEILASIEYLQDISKQNIRASK